MIEVKDLTKSFGAVTAVDHITFSVNKGEILGFLGPNGAGKTTTMRILTGFIPATGGTATIAGFDSFEDSMEVRRRIGYSSRRCSRAGRSGRSRGCRSDCFEDCGRCDAGEET